MIKNAKAFQLSHNFEAFIVRREIARGNIGVAADWLRGQSIGEQTLYRIYADFTTARVYIAVGKNDSAIILLRKILDIANSFNRPMDILEAQILLAIAYWKKPRGFKKTALEFLDAAVLTAEPYCFEQMFILNGAELTNMLNKMQKRTEQQKDENKKHITFIKMLYSKTRECVKFDVAPGQGEASKNFTDRQKEIMRLLVAGKRHVDIAGELGIKRATVCSHLLLIYKKLDVATAVDAITKINASGLLME